LLTEEILNKLLKKYVKKFDKALSRNLYFKGVEVWEGEKNTS
jgi:hypothetical protein